MDMNQIIYDEMTGRTTPEQAQKLLFDCLAKRQESLSFDKNIANTTKKYHCFDCGHSHSIMDNCVYPKNKIKTVV